MNDLFGPKPRRPRRQMMHVFDAGDACSGADGDEVVIARCRCLACGGETEWIEFHTMTEARRGIPCPQCNGQG
ncbi:hypothetical protein DFR34_10813 [Rivihabitans pingtungensis]|uniref:Uncharacterized protein n=1 Tax=Rivihabitans pingtungensis TaxID=1054498 RepID=A0A318L0R3_9NEIS|nr:hypothetical protein DFR34_10813 [Rivihabitans pingtungensis]